MAWGQAGTTASPLLNALMTGPAPMSPERILLPSAARVRSGPVCEILPYGSSGLPSTAIELDGVLFEYPRQSGPTSLDEPL